MSFIQKPTLSQLEATPSVTPQPTSTSTLIINNPEDEQIVTNKTMTVSGTTQPNVFVVIANNDHQFLTTADGSGNFSLQIELEAGSNVIQVHSIDEEGKTTSQERTVIFTTASTETEGSTATASASPKASAKP